MKRLLSALAITIFIGCTGETATGTVTAPPKAVIPDTLFSGDTITATACDTTYNGTHRSLKIYKNLHIKTMGGNGLWQNFKPTKTQEFLAKTGDCIIKSDSESVWFVPDSITTFFYGSDSTLCKPSANWKKLEVKK